MLMEKEVDQKSIIASTIIQWLEMYKSVDKKISLIIKTA